METRTKLWIVATAAVVMLVLCIWARWTISDYALDGLSFADDRWKLWLGSKYVLAISAVVAMFAGLLAFSEWDFD